MAETNLGEGRMEAAQQMSVTNRMRAVANRMQAVQQISAMQRVMNKPRPAMALAAR